MLLRKLFRTAWKYKAQFISMIIMTAIGVGVFAGFNMEWISIEKNTNEFFGDTEYADYRIYNEYGFGAEDIEKIKSIEGIDAASRVLAVNVGVKDSKNSLNLFVAEDYEVSTMLVTKGEEYDENKEGFWISDKYAKENDVNVGDELKIVYRGVEISGEIKGLVKSSEYMVCVADENQLMPDLKKFGFAYTTPSLYENVLGIEYYPQINIISELSKSELEEKIKENIGTTTLVVPKEDHVCYAAALSEIEEGRTMGAVLPVLFLAIAILTMVTTMHRIAANEKIQIGTLKALGFRDRRILRHYTSYGLVIGLIGSALGVALGFLIARIILSPNGMMATYFDLPHWNLYIPWFCYIVIGLTIVFLTFISFLSVKKMLKGTAADALRPYVPKKVKPLIVENTKIWQKLSFSTKWNMRDIVRHKARTFMTLFGIVGCMLLMVGGLGMKDTMDAFIDLIDKDINNYKTKVNIVETADNEEIMKFAENLNADWQSSVSIKLDDEAIALDIYDINDDKINFFDEDDNKVQIKDDGAYICIRLADKYKIGDTITFSPYGEKKTYTVKVKGIIRSTMTKNITITKEYAEKLDIPYQIGALYTDVETDDIEDKTYIEGKQTKKDIIDSYDNFTEILNIMVIILILGAVILGTVVLYNLGVMSYVERSRELATLKVVGFRDKHIGKILISQNMWLTVVGVLIGLPAGVGVLHLLLTLLGTEYELKLTLGWLSYSVSMLLTFGVSIIVGIFVARKNKEIDMVEALKGRE